MDAEKVVHWICGHCGQDYDHRDDANACCPGMKELRKKEKREERKKKKDFDVKILGEKKLKNGCKLVSLELIDKEDDES